MHAVLTKPDISPFSLNACPQPFIAGGRIGETSVLVDKPDKRHRGSRGRSNSPGLKRVGGGYDWVLPAVPCSHEHLQLIGQPASIPDGDCSALHPHSHNIRGLPLDTWLPCSPVMLKLLFSLRPYEVPAHWQ